MAESPEPHTVFQPAAYSEASQTIRHYSTRIMQIRTLAVVQNLALLGVIGLLINGDLFIGVAAFSLFGLALSVVLLFLHHNYYLIFEDMLDYVVRHEPEPGLWRHYHEQRNKHVGRPWFRESRHYSPFILMIIAMIILFLFGLATAIYF